MPDANPKRAGDPRVTAPRAPAGAPNVLVVLLDDMGFGASSAFGGPCRMPAAERLARDGLRYSRFHTTALCSPTRSALLTGRNHHSVGMGTVINLSTAAPGYNGLRPKTKATLAEILRQSGYATGAFGKMHQTPRWETSPLGPFDRWPTGEGFERFYGFVGGETNQFAPNLTDGTTFVDPPGTEADGYHLSEDLADKAIDWVRQLAAFRPEQPWLCYLSFGATHAPFHVPRDWRDRYRGCFDHGWDAQRERTLARQREIGVVPAVAELAPWSPGVPRWAELSDPERAVAARLMEMYAAFAEHTDAQVGRVVDALDQLGALDDTIVFYVLGDNGASAEGGLEGTLNEMLRVNAVEEDVERMVERIDEIGGPLSNPNYPVGWALAMDTPYQWTKQVASHYGGTRNGLVVHWPRRVRDAGGVRHQWHHVIDVVPTVLEAAGLPHPDEVEGTAQDPIEGTSMLYSIDDGDASDRHLTQYFEMHGNRGVYHHGWTAVAKHRTPWTVGIEELGDFDDDRWELYDTRTDWTQARDVAERHPTKLAELQELFVREAERFDVLPLDDRFLERLVPGLADRPRAPHRVVLDASMQRFAEDVVPDVKNRSFRVRIALEVTDEGDDGVLVAQGGRFGGWAVFVDEGVPVCHYNYVDLERTELRGTEKMSTGEHAVEIRFDYDGGGIGKGGLLTVEVDGRSEASGRLARTVPFAFSVDEPLSVGRDRGTPVAESYPRALPCAYSGALRQVEIETAADGVEPGKAARLSAALTEQ